MLGSGEVIGRRFGCGFIEQRSELHAETPSDAEDRC
jgi:hypothetical protein